MKIRKVGLYCGERLFSLNSWRRYRPVFRFVYGHVSRGKNGKFGFAIGPILFWDGS